MLVMRPESLICARACKRGLDLVDPAFVAEVSHCSLSCSVRAGGEAYVEDVGRILVAVDRRGLSRHG